MTLTQDWTLTPSHQVECQFFSNIIEGQEG
jgi:hypothetical protein